MKTASRGNTVLKTTTQRTCRDKATSTRCSSQVIPNNVGGLRPLGENRAEQTQGKTATCPWLPQLATPPARRATSKLTSAWSAAGLSLCKNRIEDLTSCVLPGLTQKAWNRRLPLRVLRNVASHRCACQPVVQLSILPGIHDGAAQRDEARPSKAGRTAV